LIIFCIKSKCETLINNKTIMKKNVIFSIVLFTLFSSRFSACQDRFLTNDYGVEVLSNKWQTLNTIGENGLLEERVDLWRNHRLWYMAESGYLLSGFESRPGVHPWQGEHVGKWLHAATLAYEVTGDEKLKKELDNTVERLISTQLPNGYLGTYAEDNRFYVVPEDTKGWDVWTHRYNLYGLLTYEKYHPDENIVNVCRKMGDLLIETFGKGKADITKYGTRQGISSTTLLESIVMLYERTKDEKYLNFAEQIVAWSENNPRLRLMDAMLKNESVVYPGDGKAYQLMANLLGYLRLYRCTGNDKYLHTVLNGWQEIHEKHILVTGGPWSRKMPYNGNRECFAKTEDFNPRKVVVENCCNVTWMQLNIHLFEFTGEAKYFNEAELTLLNDLYEHQHTDGIDWCYFTTPNEPVANYQPRFSCCASSGPRGLEMFSSHLAGNIDDHLSINSLAPATIELTNQFGGGILKIESDFPFGSSAEILFETDRSKEYTVEFRLSAGTSLNHVKINEKTAEAKENSRGFFELTHKWKNGDVLAIDMEYKLEMHVQDGEEGQKWIAFTYGPLVLAQKIKEMPGEEPFDGLKISLDEPEKILNMLSKSEADDSNIIFTVKDTDIILIPYYLTGTRESGPRTYFECSP